MLPICLMADINVFINSTYLGIYRFHVISQIYLATGQRQGIVGLRRRAQTAQSSALESLVRSGGDCLRSHRLR